MLNVVQESIDITQGDSNCSGSDTIAATWGDLWVYRVPVGIGHVLMPAHTFSCYLHSLSTPAAEVEDNALVKIVMRDSASQEEKPILTETLYKTLKEFQDVNLKARLNLKEPLKVVEEQYIVVKAKTLKGVDVTGGAKESYFDLEAIRVREAL